MEKEFKATLEQMEQNLSKLIADHFQKQDGRIASQIKKSKEEEMVDEVVPAATKAVQESLALAIRPLQASIDQLNKTGVKVDKNDLIEAAEKRLHEPLRSTVANSLEDGIIPAFESVTGQVVQQISDPIARLPSSFPDNIAQLVDLTSKMASMTKAMENMQSQIEILFSATARNPGLTSNSDSSKLAVADNAGSVAPMQQQQQQQQQTMDEPHDSEDELEAIQEDEPEAIRGEEKLEAIRNKISQLVQECRYEDAFTYALSIYIRARRQTWQSSAVLRPI